MGIEITKPRIIVCEGKADVAFFDHLIQQRGLPEFQVLAADGRSGYAKVLLALSAAPNFERISGILVVGDNDLDPSAAFRNIQDQIREAGGYGVPNRPGEAARSQLFPTIIVMMVPWQGRVGCLETLLVEAVYDARVNLRRCVDDYTVCARTDGWTETEQAKMKLQVLISAICKSDPNTAVSYAWSRAETIIPLDRPCFDQIAGFLETFDNLVA